MAEASHTDIVPTTLPLPSVAAMNMEQATDAEIVPLRLSFPSAADDAPAPDTRAALFDWKKTTMPWVLCVLVGFHVVAFIATMFVNNCGHGHGECVLRSLGRFSFQPLSENPSLGPSASTLDKMGALKQSLFNDHQIWRLFTSPLLHAGLIHLLVNLGSVIYVGIHLEQHVGPARIGLIYILSALCGSLTAALFLRNRPTVGSSGATFGLLGTMLAALIRDWKSYTNKISAVVWLVFLLVINILLSLMPLINGFANIGGITAGLLLGLLIPHVNDVSEDGPDKYGSKKSIYMKEKFVRVACLCIFVFIVAGSIIALHSMNFKQECQECHYSGINIGVQHLFMLISIPLLVNFTLQGEEEAAVRRLRSLVHIGRRLTAVRNEYNDTSEKLNRAKGSGESKKKLSKIEKKLSALALSVDAAQTDFDQTRDFVSRRPTVESLQDLELVRQYLPQVTAVFSSGRLGNSLNRDKYAEVEKKAALMNLSFD